MYNSYRTYGIALADFSAEVPVIEPCQPHSHKSQSSPLRWVKQPITESRDAIVLMIRKEPVGTIATSQTISTELMTPRRQIFSCTVFCI